MLCGGLLQTANGVSHSAVTPPNNTKDAIAAHTADLMVDARGGMTGTVKVLMNGPEALHWRQLNLTDDAGAVKSQIGESLQRLLPQGMGAEIVNVQGLETSAGYLSVTAKVSGSVGTLTAKHLRFPAFFFRRAQVLTSFLRRVANRRSTCTLPSR